jgi:hypothetical protein
LPAHALDQFVDHRSYTGGEGVARGDVGPSVVHGDQPSGKGRAGMGQRLQAQASTRARIG